MSVDRKNEVLKPCHVGKYVNLDDGKRIILAKILSVSRTKFTYEIVGGRNKGSQGTGERTKITAGFFETADEAIKEAKWNRKRLAAYQKMMNSKRMI